MIYDGFMFYNEWDILEIRMRELAGAVDKHIVVMSDVTLQGTPIEDVREKEDRIKSLYGSRVEVRVVSGLHSKGYTSWQRERLQRNGITDVMKMLDAKPDDILIVSDADEIPRRSAVKSLQTNKRWPVAFQLDVYYCYLNVGTRDYYHTAKAAPYGMVSDAQGLRTGPEKKLVLNAGWHFSYLGDAQHISNKLKSFAHTEFNRPQFTNLDVIEDKMQRMVSPWDGSEQYEKFEIDDTWPISIQEDYDRWRNYVLP